jgi:hypothetical protein
VIERLVHVASDSLGPDRTFHLRRGRSSLLTQKVPQQHIGYPAALFGGGWIGQAGGCAARRQGMGIGCAPLPGRWGDEGGALSPKAPRKVRLARRSESYLRSAEVEYGWVVRCGARIQV